MIIKRITVKRLRALREKTVDFLPGLNIIKGSDNEAGKSSLRIAITKALFQDPTTTRDKIEALTSWGTDEPWEVALEFADNGDSCRITKSFKDKTSELACTGAHEFVAKNKNTIAEKVAELTGCPSEIFFESTACIGQDELIRIIPGDAKNTQKQEAVGTITKRLQTKLSGAEAVNIPALLTKLYDKTHHRDAEGPYFHLQKSNERMASLRSQKQEQETKVNDILEKRRKLTQVREELEKMSQDLPAKQELWSKNKKLLELQKEIARDKAQYDNYQRATKLKSRIDELDDELKPFSAFVGTEEKIKQTDTTKNRLDELTRQSVKRQEELKMLKGQKPPLWIIVLGIALIAGGLAGLIANRYTWIAAVVGLFFSAYWWITRRGWKRQIESATQKINELDKEIQDNTEQMQRLLNEFGCKDYEECQKHLAEYRTKTEAKRDVLNQLNALLAGKDWEKFVEENKDLDIQMNAWMKELEELELFKLEPLALQKLEDEVKGLSIRKTELEQELGALKKFFQYTDADKDLLIEVEEELKGLEREKNFWERKRKVYDLTREILEQAHTQTLAKAADLLEAEISRYIATITDGRYSQIKINESEKDLSVQTFSPEKNDWVDVTDLSRATQDQFYICARLALVKLITEGKKPPILLDDPFVNFHAKRLKGMIAVLQELSKEFQILLFTCSDAYDYLGKVITIG